MSLNDLKQAAEVAHIIDERPEVDSKNYEDFQNHANPSNILDLFAQRDELAKALNDLISVSSLSTGLTAEYAVAEELLAKLKQ